jgi:hypothetical protein
MGNDSKTNGPRDHETLSGPRSHRGESAASLYFFPDDHVTEGQLRQILISGSREQRCWVISHLLRFAQWDDIWLYISRDEVREVFAEVELPENLRTAWARMLKIEAPVG